MTANTWTSLAWIVAASLLVALTYHLGYRELRTTNAYDGDAPWPLDEPVVFDVSPAVKADGEFTLTDRTMGLISKPAHNQHLAQNLASDIVASLQNDVFTRPSTTR